MGVCAHTILIHNIYVVRRDILICTIQLHFLIHIDVTYTFINFSIYNFSIR